jgi:hypothetical protein
MSPSPHVFFSFVQVPRGIILLVQALLHQPIKLTSHSQSQGTSDSFTTQQKKQLSFSLSQNSQIKVQHFDELDECSSRTPKNPP